MSNLLPHKENEVSRFSVVAAWTVASVILVGVSMAAEPAAAPSGPQGVAVLDTVSYWRMHHTLKGPVVEANGAWKTLLPAGSGRPSSETPLWDKIMLPQTATPPADWSKAEFDDSSWFRGPARRACRSPYLERLCLRGKFTIADPAQVKDLRLALEYHGGAVVYVNGQELARQHLPSGAALAEAYPAEAFVDEAGKLILLRGDEPIWKQKPPAEVARRIQSRERNLSVAIPAKALRPGVNVLAVEILRAPYHKAVEEQMQTSLNHGKHEDYDLSWNTCEIRGARLTASGKQGLVPSVTRPEGFQVWNSDPLAIDYDLDFGDPAESLRPIQLVGARNGIYSGKVAVGCDRPIRGLTATVGELRGPAGSIAASQVRIRYAMPWGNIAQTNTDNNEQNPYPAEPGALLAMFDTAPKEIPVYTKPVTPASLKAPGQPATVFGAVAPVWVTVKVPADAKPGTYTGELKITAEGWKGATVPVNVRVVDWELPNPAQWRTWVEIIQCPDTSAVEYELPLWSQKHWAMIERSLGFLGEVGTRVVYVPLIAQCNLGNAESMVRWIKKGEDQYEYDFSIMDKYLALTEKHVGKPAVVVFNVWDAYMPGTGKLLELRMGKTGTGTPLVTMVDPATGKTEKASLPAYSDPAGKAIWKPFFDRLKAEMAKRGLEKAMVLGRISDVYPVQETVIALKELTGDMPWISAGHYARPTIYEGPALVKSMYQASYFGVSFGIGKSQYGWKNPVLHAMFERQTGMDYGPMGRWRTAAEQAITGSIRGIGRAGADTWAAVKDKSGRRIAKVWERFPGSDFPGLNIEGSTLAPSPDGPVATQRLEALREGAQDCEARILLEDALTDKAKTGNLGADLAKQCQDLLDARNVALWRGLSVWQSGPNASHEVTTWRFRPAVTGYVWFLGSGWQERSERLFSLAGEVEKKLAGK